MLLTIAIGYIFLFVYRFIKKGKTIKLDFAKGYWLFPYFIGLGIISYLDAFGGHNVIKFGWDFLVLAVFSLLIFYWAVNSSRKEEV